MAKLLKPLTQFFCDSCNELIDTPADGYIEFDKNEQLQYNNFKIVHNEERCFQGLISSFELSRLLGSEGIGILSSWVHVGPITDPVGREKSEYASVVEFAEFFKRLQLPYYEQARHYLKRAVESGYIDGNATGSHYPEGLKNIVSKFLEDDLEDEQ